MNSSDVAQNLRADAAGFVKCVVALTCLTGIASPCLGAIALFGPSYHAYVNQLFILCAVFALMAQWSVRLPSGATWRPAMGFVTACIFLIPSVLAPLVAIPGLIYITSQGNPKWWDYLLTVGHVSFGLYAGRFVFEWLNPAHNLHLPYVLPSATLALVVHLCVNRFIAAAIIAHRKKRSFRIQLKLVFDDLNWGYFNLYLLGLVTAIVYSMESVWGLVLAFALLVGSYKSVAYFSKAQTLQQQAWTDGLTGVQNRTAWDEFIRQFPRKSYEGHLMVIDLDHFKLINDVHGHLVGDEVLREVGLSLQSCLSKRDRLFRYGGDEFVLYLENRSGLEGGTRSNLPQLRQRIEVLNKEWEERGLPVRISMGLADVSTETTDLLTVLSEADARMYANKVENKQVRCQVQ